MMNLIIVLIEYIITVALLCGLLEKVEPSSNVSNSFINSIKRTTMPLCILFIINMITIAFMSFKASMPSAIFVSFVLAVFMSMAIEDECTMYVHNFYHILVFLALTIYTIFFIDNPIIYLFRGNELYPLVFLFILMAIPKLRKSIGTADMLFMAENGILFTLIIHDPLYTLLNWLTAYSIHGLRNLKNIHKGSLTTPKPFIFSLAVSTSIYLILFLVMQ